MFNNIGGKIKGLAIVFTVIGMLGSIAGGIALIVIDEELIATGVILMIAGTLISWISSFSVWFRTAGAKFGYTCGARDVSGG